MSSGPIGSVSSPSAPTWGTGARTWSTGQRPMALANNHQNSTPITKIWSYFVAGNISVNELKHSSCTLKGRCRQSPGETT